MNRQCTPHVATLLTTLVATLSATVLVTPSPAFAEVPVVVVSAGADNFQPAQPVLAQPAHFELTSSEPLEMVAATGGLRMR